MSASDLNNSDNAATTAGRPGFSKGTVREQFVHQSENLIKRIAADLPEGFLTLAMSNLADVSDDTLAHWIERIGDLDPVRRVLLLRAVSPSHRAV